MSERKTFWFAHSESDCGLLVTSAAGTVTPKGAMFTGDASSDFKMYVENDRLHETRESAIMAFIQRCERNISSLESNLERERNLLSEAKEALK
jgi:hypothetical protein